MKDAIILAGRSAQHAGVKAVASGRWLADIVIQTGGHIPVRDLDTLIDHYDGKQGPALAEALVRNASRTSGAVGRGDRGGGGRVAARRGHLGHAARSSCWPRR